MMSIARKFVVPALLFSLAGCGLKGPLYLPDARQEEVAAPATGPGQKPAPKPVMEGSRVRTLPPAPQSQKKDRQKDGQKEGQKDSQRSNSSTEPQQSAPPPVSPPDPDRPATTTPPPGQ